MKEWKENKLGELIDLGIANLQTGPFGTMLNASEYSSNGIPVIAVQDIGDNKLVYHKFVYVPDETAERLSRYRVKEHDIIFGRKGAVDRRALVKKSEEGWLQGSDCIRLRFTDEINAKFISYQLGSDSHKEWMFQFATGATMPSLNQEILKLLPITLPSLPEQTAIATVLSSLDEKIDLLHRQNKTLEGLAEVVFRGWFVEGARSEWEEKGLDEIAEFLNGLACQKYPPKPTEVGLPVIKIKEMKAGITDASDIATKDVPEKYIVEDGDMLFSWSGSLDVVLWSGGTGVLNQHLFKVSSTEFPQWFYYQWVKQHLIDFKGIAEDKATTMGHIQRHHLSDAIVLVPSKKELETMNETMNPLFEKIKANNSQIRTLTGVRDELLPKVMSGEVRVGGEILG